MIRIKLIISLNYIMILLIHILLPLTSQFLVTCLILSFSQALGEFGAAFMLAGNIPGARKRCRSPFFTALEAGDTTLA
ncbi:hypothetical protein HUG20_02035 [Salicibibacter cibi]|uniref:Uncharacterized protein n=1 Tax=Salicibibacter cibi TaxID=2743001 RepID=A0A7T6Z8G9_9BACI|nr:hypothetical protein [Salicibibacter cibi]QQK78802.1 hypothetical protein HUG20_02035 [Salicibibacter cibi]